jgi:hypothetical protein
MRNLRRGAKAFALGLSALLCSALAAQDLRMAVLQPVGAKEASPHFALVRNALSEVVAGANGFQAFDRARTDQILKEHSFQNNGLVSPKEARELGRMLGVDLICTTELQWMGDGLSINSSLIDIVTGEVVGAKSDLVGGESSKEIMDAARGVMAEMLAMANRKLAGGLNRDLDRGPKSASGASKAAPAMVAGLDAEIARSLKNFRSNAKWNNIKQNCEIEIDFGGLDIRADRQHGETYYVVTGSIDIAVSDLDSGREANVEVEIEQFAEMNKDQIKKKIKGQISMVQVVGDLLSYME